MLWRTRKQKERLKRACLYVFLGVVPLGMAWTFLTPYLRTRYPKAKANLSAATAFDEKVRALRQAYYRDEEAEIRINDVEASSRLRQLLTESPAREKVAPSLDISRIRFAGNYVILEGTALYLTGDSVFEIRGRLRTKDGIVEFVPMFMSLGGVAVLPRLLEPNLQAFLDGPEIRFLAVLPKFIKNARIENSELILTAAD